MNDCFLFWRKLRTRTQYPCTPPPPPGRPSLGNRFPPQTGRPSRANTGDCKGGGGYLPLQQQKALTIQLFFSPIQFVRNKL